MTEKLKSKNIPAIEADPGAKKVYLLDHELPMGEFFAETKEQRERDAKFYTLDAKTAEVLSKIANGVEMSSPTMLEGPTSASKTSAIEYLAHQTGNKCLRINLSGQTDTSELIGKFIPNISKEPGAPPFIWKDGLLPQAMKMGFWIIFDEINLAAPEMIERINSVLEKNPSLTLTENGGVKIGTGGEFAVHANFRVFATMNPGYKGRQSFSPAFQNRWTNYVHVPAPAKEELDEMLLHHTYGIQPNIEFKGEKYEDKTINAISEYERLRKLDELKFKHVLASLSEFHAAISKLAQERDIGRDRPTEHIFTRRDLAEVLSFMAVKQKFSRQSSRKSNVLDAPANIITEALEYVYLNKMTGEDSEKVKELLEASKLDKKSLEELFKVEEIAAGTRGAAGATVNPKPEPPNPEAGHEYTPEHLKMLQTFKKQFDFQREKYCENAGKDTKEVKMEVLNAKGEYKCEIPGKHLGKPFKLPSWEEIQKRLTPAKLNIMKTLKEPIFSFYPLGLKLKTVAGKMLKDKGGGDGVRDELREETLLYLATSVNSDGSPNGAKSFDKLMDENNGFLISVADGVEEITDEMPGAKYKGLNRKKMITHVADLTTKGQGSVTYQQELSTQIQRILSGEKPMDAKFHTCVSGSLLPDFSLVPVAVWSGGRVGLGGFGAGFGDLAWRGRGGVVV